MDALDKDSSELVELVPEELLTDAKLPGLASALGYVHRPTSQCRG